MREVYQRNGNVVGAQFYNFAMGKVRAVVATGLTSKASTYFGVTR